VSRRELTEKQIVQGSLAKMAADREADDEDADYDGFDSWGDDEARCPQCFELMTEGSAHRCRSRDD